MNPFDLSASDLLVWGIVLHLIADWPLQSDWMAKNKMRLTHPAGYVHAGIHGFCLAWIFGWAAFPLALVHLLIDTRKPVAWWSRLMRQTPPQDNYVGIPGKREAPHSPRPTEYIPIYDMGIEVRIWVDQVFHITCIAVAALLVT